MSENTVIHRSFQRWKMWTAILIGLTVATLMLYYSLTTVRFIKVFDGSGQYSWQDFNNNGIVDVALQNEFVLNPEGNYRQQTFSDVLSHIHWTKHSILWILIALLFMVGRDLFYIVRIRLLTHKELSWKSGFNVIMLWEFASALSPGVISGAAVAMFILNKEKIELGRATAIVFITAMMDNLFYILMIPFVFLFIDASHLFPQHSFGSTSVEWVFWTGFSVLLLVCLFLFSSVFLLPKLPVWFLSALFSLPFLKRWKSRALQTGRSIEMSSIEMKKESFGFWLKVFAATCASWTSRYLVINALLQAFLNLGMLDQVLILGKQLVLWLFMRMSPTPGGSGIAEYAFAELLSSFSQSALLLTGLAIIWRLISYFPYLFIGAFLLPRWLKKN